MKNLISVTVMVRDSGHILDEFLKKLNAQKVNVPYELVVLYYGIDEKTYKKLLAFTSNIIRIPPNKFSFGKSRDLVCSRALGKYIVTASIDGLPTNDHWLQKLIDPIKSGKVDVVQGHIQCPQKGDPNYPDFFYWEKKFMFYFSSEGADFIKKNGNMGFSCINLAFRSDVWKKIKFSGVTYCEDKIFQKRLFGSKFTCMYNKSAPLLHAHAYKTIKSVFKRCANEGHGWKEVGENYGVNLFLKDICRIDLHIQAIQALVQNKLKYNSEIFFFFLRPIALYWGNHFTKKVY